MSDYVIVSPFVPGQALAASNTGTTALCPIGLKVAAIDRAQNRTLTSADFGGGYGEFIYCRGSDVGTSGQVCSIVNGSAVKIAAANSTNGANQIGVAAGALSATNVYGWVQVYGKCDFIKGTSGATNLEIVAGQELFVVAGTAGFVQNKASIAGNRIDGMVALYSRASDAATNVAITADLNYPILAHTGSN